MEIEIMRKRYLGADINTPEVSFEIVTLSQFFRAHYVEEIWDAVGFLGVVPPIHIVNDLIGRGPQDNTKWTAWSPFVVSPTEYGEVQIDLNEGSNGYCIEDQTLWIYNDYKSWREALVQKIQENPRYKELSWGVKHAVLGIPIGYDKWIQRKPVANPRRATPVDPILRPLSDFLVGLYDCTPDCCGIQAFSFDSETIIESCAKTGRLAPMGAIDQILIDLDNADIKHGTIYSEMMNTTLHLEELIALLRHFEEALSQTT